jgi:rRNA maturation endonuclease Nob1
LGKKGLAIWLFSTLTLISFLHLIDAINAIVFNNRIRLLQLYPFINEQLEQIPIDAYFYVSVASTVILWGITCVIAFDNPVEAFLNKIMSDAKKQSATETQLLESKSELLELTYETVESDRETLAQVKDLMCNVRSDVRDIQPMKEIMEKTQIEIGNLKKQIKIFDEKLHFTILCSACGKPLMPEFKICPYCGENVKLEEKMIMVKNYK